MKKLLVILGAGSSVALGMPSVFMLDGVIRSRAQAWATKYGFTDYYAALSHSISTYYHSSSNRLKPPLNFEKVLGEMMALVHWLTPAPWGDTLRQTACAGATPPALFPDDALNRPYPFGAMVMVMDQLKDILVDLAQHMRELCRNIDDSGVEALKYRALFEGLHDAFDVGVYNLNYDTAALAACPAAYTGFTPSGAFDRSGIHKREDWGFVYHLHGSVHHSLAGNSGEEILWREDLSGAFCDGHQGLANDKGSDGRSFPKTTLIAGGFKLDQLLAEPFHSQYATLVKHVYAADAILIGGYGFADVHINRALRNRLMTAGSRPPVMVLDLANQSASPTRFRDDLWANQLFQVLCTNGYFFLEPGNSSPSPPAELVARRAFDVAAVHRTGIWYGGFSEARSRLDYIVRWLQGQPDEVLTSDDRR